jgi:ABC-type nitrate/sulfonate/bicarbonate transport system ATPase subunit
MSDVLLSVTHLNKRFETLRVIEDVSFTMRWGERLALYAPSGAGKTTLINILSGLETADSGSFQFNGCRPVTIFQDGRLFPYLTVEENIWLPFKVENKKPTLEQRQNYQRWLEVCSLGDVKQKYPHQLSGGMKQKVALLRALLPGPQIVLMDEPFHSMDWASKLRIIECILETCPQMAFLLVTHQAEEIPLLAESVLFAQASSLRQVVKMDLAGFQAVQTRLNEMIDLFRAKHTELSVTYL